MQIKTVWQRLKETIKPIVMYGMGDGAEKIMKVFGGLEIQPSAFMASDEFVRGQSFLGYKVHTLSQIQEMYSDFIIVVCFGSSLPEVTSRLYDLDSRYELYAPDVPVTGGGLFDGKYLEENRIKLEQVRSLLADDFSRKVLDDIITYKLTGQIKYLRSCETPEEEAYRLLNLTHSEIYVDMGAYNGDTVEKFLSQTDGKFNEIYALEPDSRSFKKMLKRLENLDNSVFHPINAAAWNENATLKFQKSGNRSSSADNSYGRGKVIDIPAVSVDYFLNGSPATFMKLDVEGSEREALDGAAKTISTYKPKLLLSLYHRTEDLLDLPLKIMEMNSKYSLYLRHHPYIPAWDTNLYCI